MILEEVISVEVKTFCLREN